MPPLLTGKSRAAAFRIIAPMSGRNNPYDPDIVIPGFTWPVTLLLVALPLLPETTWNILPASQYVIIDVSPLLSVKSSSKVLPDIAKFKLPGNKDCLYLDLSIAKT
jgi:hypothetical protein